MKSWMNRPPEKISIQRNVEQLSRRDLIMKKEELPSDVMYRKKMEEMMMKTKTFKNINK